MSQDSLQTFLFEDTDIRGAIITLEQSFRDMVNGHDYSPGQQRLLAQFVAANLLLTSHIKFDGLLSLQARGEQGVSLIMAECTQDLAFRGIVRGTPAINPDAFKALFTNGTFAITIQPERGSPYQGIVELGQATLADSLAAYFDQSEQIPSWFYFAEQGGRVTGLMLQALPANRCHDPEQRQEDWQRIVHLASTISDREALELPTEQLLHRLYHEERVRLFDPRPVHFHCHCSRERMERALISLGRDELMEMLDEDGQIETRCHFCNQRYLFPRAEMLHLLQGSADNPMQ